MSSCLSITAQADTASATGCLVSRCKRDNFSFSSIQQRKTSIHKQQARIIRHQFKAYVDEWLCVTGRRTLAVSWRDGGARNVAGGGTAGMVLDNSKVIVPKFSSLNCFTCKLAAHPIQSAHTLIVTSPP